MTFADSGTENIYDGTDSKKARKTLPRELHGKGARKVGMVLDAEALTDLKKPPNNKLEALKGDRKGQHSIRINDQHRICFVWSDDGGAEQVEIVDFH